MVDVTRRVTFRATEFSSAHPTLDRVNGLMCQAERAGLTPVEVHAGSNVHARIEAESSSVAHPGPVRPVDGPDLFPSRQLIWGVWLLKTDDPDQLDVIAERR